MRFFCKRGGGGVKTDFYVINGPCSFGHPEVIAIEPSLWPFLRFASSIFCLKYEIHSGKLTYQWKMQPD